MVIIRTLKNNLYYILSFLAPGVILAIVLFVFGVYPAGTKSLLILDMYNQYVDYFAYFREIFLGDRSLFYTWGKTLGGNFIGFYSYYLSSPLSFITLLFPEKNLTEAILTLNVLKISLSGLTFSILLKYLYNKKDISIVIFSSLYALMSYSVLYSQNIMWLDSLIWLPIIIIGLERIIKGERPTLYVISLSIMFISCYYLSYSMGIFLAIYFFYRISQNGIVIEGRNKIKSFLTFTWSTLLSVGCAAWLLLPTIYALRQGKVSEAYTLPGFEVKFNLYQMVSRLFVGSYENINNLGMPNIYCGILISILVILFFSNNAIEKRDKLLSGIVLLVFIISMTLNLVDIAWHGFQAPNWFPSRYSFMFCFFMILTAYKTWINIESTKPIQLLGAAAIAFSMVFITQQLHYDYLPDNSIFLTYMLLASYIGLLYTMINSQKIDKLILIIVVLLSFGELYYNTTIMIKGLDTQVGFQQKSAYTDFRDTMLPIIQRIEADDAGNYRMEMNFYRSRNEAIAFGYKGITNYTSIYQQAVNNYCGKMGLAQENTRTIYNGDTIWMDSMFGLKYIISKAQINNYYESVFKHKDITVYKNPYALSLGFMVDQDSLKQNYSSPNPYLNQNNLMQKMTDTTDPYFVTIENVRIDSANLVYTQQEGGKLLFSKQKLENEGIVYYTFNAPQDGPIYGFLTSENDEACQLYVNDVSLDITFDAEKNCTIYLGDFKNGEIVQVKFIQTMTTKSVNKAYFASLNVKNLSNAVNLLKKSEFVITDCTDSHLEGTVNVTDKRLLFTSIPSDPGWSISVDGKKVEQQTFDGTFICLELSEGSHKIVMDYISYGIIPGLIVSGFSILLLLLVVYMPKKGAIKLKKAS